MDGRQCSRQGATDNTTTNHRQDCRRCSDVGGGCSKCENGGKGEDLVAAASAVAAVTAYNAGVVAAASEAAAAVAAATGSWPPSCHR